MFGTTADSNTYFGQVLDDSILPGLNELYGAEEITPAMVASPAHASRKGRFLDHLLARFAENFADYSLLIYARHGRLGENEILAAKAALAADLVNFHPARAYAYHQPAWEAPNVAGITRRFGRLAGLANFEARQTTKLATVAEPGFDPKSWAVVKTSEGQFTHHCLKNDPSVTSHSKLFDSHETANTALEQYLLRESLQARTATETVFVVEHVLLRPEPYTPSVNGQWLPVNVDPDGRYVGCLDPYSFCVTIVLPGESDRFAHADYREYAERVLRAELPAHIMARICWVSSEALATFEVAYEKWLLHLQGWGHLAPTLRREPDTAYAHAVALADFVAVLRNLHTTFESGRLYSCSAPADSDHPFLVLDRTALGSIRLPNS